MPPIIQKPKREHSNAGEQVLELVRLFHDRLILKRWTDLSEEVGITDPGLAAALMTGRAELVKTAKPRALTEAECKTLYHLVCVLLETNQLLQQHAAQVAQLVENWTGHFKGLASAGNEIAAFADWQAVLAEEEDNA